MKSTFSNKATRCLLDILQMARPFPDSHPKVDAYRMRCIGAVLKNKSKDSVRQGLLHILGRPAPWAPSREAAKGCPNGGWSSVLFNFSASRETCNSSISDA